MAASAASSRGASKRKAPLVWLVVPALWSGSLELRVASTAPNAAVEGEPMAHTFMVNPAGRPGQLPPRCLDGTVPRYWVQNATAASGSTKWSIHLQGGTCTVDATRAARVAVGDPGSIWSKCNFRKTAEAALAPARPPSALRGTPPPREPLLVGANPDPVLPCDRGVAPFRSVVSDRSRRLRRLRQLRAPGVLPRARLPAGLVVGGVL